MKPRDLLCCPLFNHVTQQELPALLTQLHTYEKVYQTGSYVYRRGECSTFAGILLAGRVVVVQQDLWGNENIFNQFQVGDMIGETYACASNAVFMVDVLVQQEAKILFVDLSKLNNLQLLQNMNTILAQKNLYLSRKLGHVTPKTIRVRLLSYLYDVSIQQQAQRIEIPFDRQQLANYLCVDRSALSHEISKLTKEGILKSKGSTFLLSTTTAQ